MKRLHVAVGLIALGAVCSLVGCKELLGGRGGGSQPRLFAGPGDSPVVVRGGAMTVRTKDSVGWKGASVPFCTGIGLTGGTLYFNYSGLETAKGYAPPQPTPIALTGNWSVKIVGRLHNGADSTQASGNGVIITPVGSCSGASTEPDYVQLSTASNNSDFYAPDPALKEEPNATAYTAKRFMDKTPAGTPGTNCQGPSPKASNLGDEDACERASLVTIQTTSGGPYYGWCSNGECVIGLGDIPK